MDTPLEGIRFLADSENRFVALEALASGPRTRSELRRPTESSKATISRLIGDFKHYGWVARECNRYALMPVGDYVAATFVDLYDHMKAPHELLDPLRWFPIGELDQEFDLEVLVHYYESVTCPSPVFIMANLRRGIKHGR